MSVRRARLALLALPALACLAPPAPGPAAHARVARAVHVAWHYQQGLARAGSGWVFSSNDGLYRTDAAYVETLAREPAIPPEWRARGYNHIGDIDIVGDVLYAPLEQSDYTRGHQALLVFAADTLEFREGFELAQRENSFVSVDPERQIAYSMDRFGGRELLRYDVRRAWQPLAPLALSRRVERVQGGDVWGDAIWLSTDDDVHGLYRVDLATGEVAPQGSLGHRFAEIQGIDAALLPGGLRVLVIDFVPLPSVRALDVELEEPRQPVAR